MLRQLLKGLFVGLVTTGVVRDGRCQGRSEFSNNGYHEQQQRRRQGSMVDGPLLGSIMNQQMYRRMVDARRPFSHSFGRGAVYGDTSRKNTPLSQIDVDMGMFPMAHERSYGPNVRHLFGDESIYVPSQAYLAAAERRMHDAEVLQKHRRLSMQLPMYSDSYRSGLGESDDELDINVSPAYLWPTETDAMWHGPSSSGRTDGVRRVTYGLPQAVHSPSAEFMFPDYIPNQDYNTYSYARQRREEETPYSSNQSKQKERWLLWRQAQGYNDFSGRLPAYKSVQAVSNDRTNKYHNFQQSAVHRPPSITSDGVPLRTRRDNNRWPTPWKDVNSNGEKLSEMQNSNNRRLFNDASRRNSQKQIFRGRNSSQPPKNGNKTQQNDSAEAVYDDASSLTIRERVPLEVRRRNLEKAVERFLVRNVHNLPKHEDAPKYGNISRHGPVGENRKKPFSTAEKGNIGRALTQGSNRVNLAQSSGEAAKSSMDAPEGKATATPPTEHTRRSLADSNSSQATVSETLPPSSEEDKSPLTNRSYDVGIQSENKTASSIDPEIISVSANGNGKNSVATTNVNSLFRKKPKEMLVTFGENTSKLEADTSHRPAPASSAVERAKQCTTVSNNSGEAECGAATQSANDASKTSEEGNSVYGSVPLKKSQQFPGPPVDGIPVSQTRDFLSPSNESGNSRVDL